MLIGYGRVSTTDQDPQMQIAALKAAGCEKIFADTASGAQLDRPELMAALEFMRPGDTLVVWKLDRLVLSRARRREIRNPSLSIFEKMMYPGDDKLAPCNLVAGYVPTLSERNTILPDMAVNGCVFPWISQA